MGLFLTLFYLLTAFMAPSTLFGDLAQYHIEVIVAIFALIGALLASEKPPMMEMPQTRTLIGLSAAVFLSLLTNGWLSASWTGLMRFIPNVFAFIFIVLTCRTTRHLKMVIIVILAVCIFVVINGYLALSSGDLTSPFLIPQADDSGTIFYRIVGSGFIADPNDLAQLMVSLIPCLFFFWRPKKKFSNTVFVLAPAAFLFFGLYLTHSRGATVALLVVVMLALRRKIGTLPSLGIAVALYVGAMAVGWTGNRGVSMEAGSDRMDAWSAGLEMMKAHPIFGVGFEAFPDHYPLTAHNTVMVCAAELGISGLFPWVLFVCTSLWQSVTVGGFLIKKKKKPVEEETSPIHAAHPLPASVALSQPLRWGATARAQPVTATYGLPGGMGGAAVLSPGHAALHLEPIEYEDPEVSAKNEVQRMGLLMVYSLAGFLTAGWFLSRAFQMTLFVHCGIIQVIYQLGIKQQTVPERMPMAKLMRVSAITGTVLILILYIWLRVEHAMGIY